MKKDTTRSLFDLLLILLFASMNSSFFIILVALTDIHYRLALFVTSIVVISFVVFIFSKLDRLYRIEDQIEKKKWKDSLSGMLESFASDLAKKHKETHDFLTSLDIQYRIKPTREIEFIELLKFLKRQGRLWATWRDAEEEISNYKLYSHLEICLSDKWIVYGHGDDADNCLSKNETYRHTKVMSVREYFEEKGEEIPLAFSLIEEKDDKYETMIVDGVSIKAGDRVRVDKSLIPEQINPRTKKPYKLSIEKRQHLRELALKREKEKRDQNDRIAKTANESKRRKELKSKKSL